MALEEGLSLTFVAGFKEPLRAYNFAVRFPDALSLMFQVRSVELPSFIDIELGEVKVAPGVGVPYPEEFNGVSDKVVVEFWEDEEFSVTSYFREWMDSIIVLDRSSPYYGCFRLPVKYRRDFEVVILDVKGRSLKEVRVQDAYPVTMDKYSLSYGENSLVVLRVEFAYGYIDWGQLPEGEVLVGMPEIEIL